MDMLKRLGSCCALALVACAAVTGTHAAASDDSAGAARAGSSAAATALMQPAASPRAAMEGYLVAARAGKWDEAATYLSGGDAVGARRLKVVLDRCLWVNLDALSGDPSGIEDDGLAPAIDRVGTIEAGQVDVPIDMERGRDGAWRISNATMQALPVMWAAHGHGPIVELLPRVLLDHTVLEVALWQWIAIALLLVAGWMAALMLAPVLEWMVRSASADSGWQFVGWRMLNASRGGLRWLAALVVLRAGAGALELSVPAHDAVRVITMVLGALVGAWAVASACTGGAMAMQERALASGRQGLLAVIMLVRRTLQVVAWVIGVVIAATAAGFDMTGVLAGLGIGGIAVSLAAQRTIENIFAGINIVADQPIRVGDTCRVGTRLGTVERIGMRSVQIRSPERTLVTIPNSQFAGAEVESLAARDRMRMHMTIGLRYETSHEQMVKVLEACEGLLRAHPRVLPEGIRVRFVGFGSTSLDVEIQAFIGTRDWEEFLMLRQGILLEIMDAVARCGTGFAFPSSTVYLARDRAPSQVTAPGPA
jgi:MscS family membrane protein